MTAKPTSTPRLHVLVFAAAASYLVVVFAIDILTPIGIEVWVMDLPVILLPVLLRNARLVTAIAVVAAVLVVVGSTLSPAGANPPIWDVLNRGMGLAVMGLMTAMAVGIIRRSNALDLARHKLELESEAHRKTAATLEKHVERLRLAADAAGMGTFDLDLEGGRAYCSAAHLKLLGAAADVDLETSIEEWESWVHPEDREHACEARAAALRDRASYSIEYRVVQPDERIAWLAVFGRCYVNTGGAGTRLLGVAFDVTRRKELEREVLGREVLATVSAKQREVGQALHDTVGQELTGLGLMAHSLAARFPDGSPEWNVAGRLISGIEDTHRTVRELSRGLIPVQVEARGLFAALEDLVARMTEQSGVSVTVQYSEYFRSPPHETATQLFHIAQEAVANAVRHGRPQNVRLSLLPEPDGLRLRISDDGLGIDPRPEADSGLGLRIMHYRAALIGARLTIAPARSGGTVVACTLPWRTLRDAESRR